MATDCKQCDNCTFCFYDTKDKSWPPRLECRNIKSPNYDKIVIYNTTCENHEYSEDEV